MWLNIANGTSPAEISRIMNVSKRTVRRYLQLFQQTGDVRPRIRRHGPQRLLGSFEQLTLLRLILQRPGIYLHELQGELRHIFGVTVSVSTICKTLRFMGCSRQAMHQVALQRSDTLRANLWQNTSPSMSQPCSFGLMRAAVTDAIACANLDTALEGYHPMIVSAWYKVFCHSRDVP